VHITGTLEELNVFGVGTWPAAFDEGHADLVQPFGDADLVGARKRKAFGLSPVSQGGVVDLDILIISY
jgi:hypothetical protein